MCVVGWNWRRRLGGCEAREGLLAALAALAALGITSCLAPCVTLAAWHGHAGGNDSNEHKKTSKNCFFSLETDKIYSKFE